jgi:hypothetical protein
VVPSDLYSLLVWETDGDLGEIYDGQYLEFLIRARTERRTPIVYNVVGGMLPPHLMMNSTGGITLGYVDYHAIDKTYMFDVRATDGYQTITRQFTLKVVKRYNDQFFGAYIPITGELRDQWAADASNVRAREPGTTVINTITDIIDPPMLNIVNGVVTGYQTPDQLVAQARPWLHTLDLQLGMVSNASVNSSTYGTLSMPNVSIMSTIYREIVDRQSGADRLVYSDAVYNTNVQTQGLVYPISIENIRKAFVGDHGYITGGSGTGLVVQPILDWNDGSIADVLIINGGSDYNGPPQLTVTGSGRGATLLATIGLTDVQIVDGGQGWQVGDVFTLQGNAPNGLARVLVTQVGTNGSISSVSIVDPGDYTQVIATETITIRLNGTISCVVKPAWGVVKITVLNGGTGYECNVSILTNGGEILPSWQSSYFPAIEIGKIPTITADHAANVLNFEEQSLWGLPWAPSYMVFKWEGIRWVGSTTFDDEQTMFDGVTTRFEETEDARLTVFDDQLTVFDNGSAVFDYYDPLWYDIWRVWGGTLIDEGTTVFDLYSTIFDAMRPRRSSNTLIQKWITMQNRVYSGNNAVW